MAMGPLVGLVIRPVIGGYLAAAKGWRWVSRLAAILVCSHTSSYLVHMEAEGRLGLRD